jgi:hypothetical protein
VGDFGGMQVEHGWGVFIRFMLHNGSKCATGSHKIQVGYENNELVTKSVGHGASIVQLRETTRNGRKRNEMKNGQWPGWVYYQGVHSNAHLLLQEGLIRSDSNEFQPFFHFQSEQRFEPKVSPSLA